jgi:aminopeptidase-like protein
MSGLAPEAVTRIDGDEPPIDIHALVRTLYPLPRSLTGVGVRATLREISRYAPLEIHEVPSGTAVLDWQVPPEWTIRGAAIRTEDGDTIVDWADNNLHVVGYSLPVHRVVDRDELARHVHTLPDQPDAIPYRTGYYAHDWGFCLPHALWTTMTDPYYRVDIDSDLSPGAMSYGEIFIPGETDDELVISVHICHPSLANDNLSGVAVATALAVRQAMRRKAKLGLRILYLPATIGAITWLARNEARLPRIRHGLVLTCIGDAGPFHYKRSRSGATIDRAVAHVLEGSGHAYELQPFTPYGYDERQFCSPGYDLPFGCLMRGVHGEFPQYHTSLDDCDFVTPQALGQSYRVLTDIVDLLDADRTLERLDGRGEPQLGRRGLYRAIAGQKEAGGATQMDLLWALNLADGTNSLLDMAERANVPFVRLSAAAALAEEAGLLREID